MPEEIMPWEPRTVKSFEDFVAQWLCMPKAVAWVLLVLCAAGTVCGQGAAAAAPVQTQTDEYTRYELLSTESSSFAIRYEVTATTAGAFNPIRKGSVASGIRSMHRFEVYDLIFRSGKRIQDAGGNHALGTAHSEKLRRLRCAMAMHAQGGLPFSHASASQNLPLKNGARLPSLSGLDSDRDHEALGKTVRRRTRRMLSQAQRTGRRVLMDNMPTAKPKSSV
jgi:hypothetical protein